MTSKKKDQSTTFISQMKLTPKGLAELRSSAKRRDISEDRIATVGGKSIAKCQHKSVKQHYDGNFVQASDQNSNNREIFAVTIK